MMRLGALKRYREAHQHGHDGAERWHAAQSPVSRSPAVLAELAYWCWFLVVLVVLAVANGGSAQLLGDDLDGWWPDPAN
jgi:hypothetical protein